MIKNNYLYKSIQILLVCITVIGFASCDGQNQYVSPKPIETLPPVPTEETVSLTYRNFYDYFDVSIEYYNYADTSADSTVILGVYIPPKYKANVVQRIKITPKSNVISCDDVVLVHYANVRTTWSYSASNKGDYYENMDNNKWRIYLLSNGRYDDSKTMYYYDLIENPSCPVPSSKLNLNDISGTVTIKK